MTLLDSKVTAARALGALIRRAGRGGGTSLPGRMLIALEPGAIGELASRLPRGTVVLSATNGKTTTAAMAASILEGAGATLVHNRAGANMAGGIASTLALASRGSAGMSGELGLFEVDEFWLDRLLGELAPRAVLLSNLFRDQLDRYGELETIADRWQAAVSALPQECRLVLNADDPLIADLGRARGEVSYYGIEDPGVALAQMQHAADSKHCRNCGAAYSYDAIYMGHLGTYHCESCGMRRPAPTVAAERIELHGTCSSRFAVRAAGGSFAVELPLPGLYNVYNALAAAALCLELGASAGEVSAGLRSVTAAFGRAESIRIGDAEVSTLLIKNPAGANEIIRTLALEEGQLDVLAILNDRVADGRDVSWVWDADFELLADRLRGVVCAGTRAAELAVRLKYAGVPVQRLALADTVASGLARALAQADGRRLFVLPTYTALLELRAGLAGQGHVEQFWREQARG